MPDDPDPAGFKRLPLIALGGILVNAQYWRHEVTFLKKEMGDVLAVIYIKNSEEPGFDKENSIGKLIDLLDDRAFGNSFAVKGLINQDTFLL